jgi:hypothetical protein
MVGMKLAVIEGKWWPDRNTSVRYFFDLISDILVGNPHGYHYEMFTNGNAFQDIFERFGSDKKIDYLYIAAHGNETQLFGANGEPIDLETVHASLKSATRRKGSSLKGVFFGTCLLLNNETVSQFFRNQGAKLGWIAGYSKEVSWLASSALDTFFWTDYLTKGTWEEGDERLVPTRLPESRIEKTADRIKQLMPGLAKELGMEIYVRRDHRCVNLLEVNHDN